MITKTNPLLDELLRRFKGAELVDVRLQPAEPDADATYAAASGDQRQHSLAALQRTLINEADRIRQAQDALVAMGDRATPHAEQLQRAAEFEAAARLIDRCKADPEIMARLKKGPGK